nr:hypothetical protein [Bradyrhizobium diazoefficiens]
MRGMTRLIIPTPLEHLAPSEAPQPFTPEWLNGLSEEGRKSSEMLEFHRRMLDSGAEHVTCLVWRYQSKTIETPLLARQGSMFFLDCGRGPFAVSAGHVFEQFVEDRAKRRMRSCQIANIPFNPEERLITWGRDLGLDIATFRVTPEEIAATGKKVVQGIDGAWPAPPDQGVGVFFGGFPGAERDQIGPHEMVFGLHRAIQRLTSFTEHQLCCQFAREDWIDTGGMGLPPVGYDLGGISGGPMLQPVFVDGAWSWRLLGVISEAISVEGFERVTAVRAHYILPDGRIG